MKNKLLALLMAFITLFGLVSCSSGPWIPNYDSISFESLDKTTECTPLLYKVTDGKGAVLYLLGSIHIGDERTQSMPDYVMEAYDASSYICVEANIVAYEKDVAKQMEDLKDLLCEEGKTIKDYLGEDLYLPARKFLQSRGLYNAVYDMYKPALWSSLLDEAVSSYTDLESEYGVDRFFINKAAAEGKEIREVESVDFQNDMMNGFSDELYRLMISDMVYYPKSNVENLLSMYETWLRGDEAAIEEMLKIDYTGAPEEQVKLFTDYNKTMITDRNVGMANKAEEYMADGGTGFYIVGLAHVAGKGALAELLRGRGYTVEKVS